MLFYTHLMFALFLSLLTLEYFSFENKFLFIFIVLISSIIVDIDTYKSKIGKRIKVLSYPLNFIFGHRGLLHSIWIPLIIFFVFLSFNLNLIGFGFLLGYLSHLIIDGITKEGVRLFYPLKFRIRGFVRVGGWMEIIVFVLLFVGSLVVLV